MMMMMTTEIHDEDNVNVWRRWLIDYDDNDVDNFDDVDDSWWF